MKPLKTAEVLHKSKTVAVTLTKIVLAILLFMCLATLPYSYYQFVRFAAFIGFAFLAYDSYERSDKLFAFVYSALAILFQPFAKIALGRQLWNIIDVIVGIVLIASLFFDRKPK